MTNQKQKRLLLWHACANFGWIEGGTIAIEYRWSQARTERYAEIAAEFVRLKVDVIVTVGSAVPIVRQATTVIPIVFAVGIPTTSAAKPNWRAKFD